VRRGRVRHGLLLLLHRRRRAWRELGLQPGGEGGRVRGGGLNGWDVQEVRGGVSGRVVGVPRAGGRARVRRGDELRRAPKKMLPLLTHRLLLVIAQQAIEIVGGRGVRHGACCCSCCTGAARPACKARKRVVKK
jgi:hypothetical protein